MLTAAHLAPDRYWAAVQEDRVIEWWTALLFLAAAVVAMPRALRDRRWMDVLVALFCFFVAGEEVSWGQRLLGYTPPGAFLEHNTQQEFTLHNFRDVLGQPKWILAAVLVMYGVLLPGMARVGAGRRLLERVRLTAPPLALAPWFAAAVALLVWYPVEYTGEWVETLAGGLFLASLGGPVRVIGIAAITGLLGAVVMAQISSRRGADPALVACARAEAQAIGSAIPGNALPGLSVRRIHKRVWTAAADGYFTWNAADVLAAVTCEGAPDGLTRRRQYAVDPWGTAYWVTTTRSGETRDVIVYSFGPNRRRDGDAGTAAGDDILSSSVQIPPP